MFFLTSSSQTSIWSSVLMMAVVLVVFYFMLIRPQNKKEKAQQKMRSEMQIGDEIVTIGGIMGTIVHVTEDDITIETSEDKVRIQFKKWAVSSNVRAEAAEAKEKEKK